MVTTAARRLQQAMERAEISRVVHWWKRWWVVEGDRRHHDTKGKGDRRQGDTKGKGDRRAVEKRAVEIGARGDISR